MEGQTFVKLTNWCAAHRTRRVKQQQTGAPWLRVLGEFVEGERSLLYVGHDAPQAKDYKHAVVFSVICYCYRDDDTLESDDDSHLNISLNLRPANFTGLRTQIFPRISMLA